MLLRLHAEARRRSNAPAADDAFRGLYISEEEIGDFIANPESGPCREESLCGLAPQLMSSLRRAEAEAADIESQAVRNGQPSRVRRLRSVFGLGDFEVDVLLVCLLPEMDPGYERLLAYLNDDVTRKRPTVHLLLECLTETEDDRSAARWALLPSARLAANHLARVEEDRDSTSRAFLSRAIRIDDRVVNYMLGNDEIDLRIADAVRLVVPSSSLDEPIFGDLVMKRLHRMADDLSDGGQGVHYVWGPPGVGKRTVVEFLCHHTGQPLLLVDTGALAGGEMQFEKASALVFREAMLQDACICWSGIDPLLTGGKRFLDGLIEGCRLFPYAVFITGEADWHPEKAFSGRGFGSVALSLPSASQRIALWRSCLEARNTEFNGDRLIEIADRFRLSAAQIREAAAAAENLAGGGNGDLVRAEHLFAACRALSNQNLSTLARKVQPKFRWHDIVLPQDQMLQLREIADWVKHGSRVYDEWNFDSKVSLGRGLNVLFAGPSGTGKTMAAEILANELSIDLYKIDLATVVSKYIGETEKNLDRVFGEARSSNAILFFDEADAIFGKRSEVRDSHDRYANIEIAYLLQKMEEYDGIAILATNLRKNLDEAFARRMHFCVEFSVPEEQERHRIWGQIFPGETPLSRNVDLGFLARQFKMSGGNIKNIALAAAFLAAADGGTIGMEHLVRATRREYQKVGRLCNEADFGPYFQLVKA